MQTRKVTTREFEGAEWDEDGCLIESFSEQPVIDVALSMLAWLLHGEVNFSGSIKTHWLKGGLREPQTPAYNNNARREIIVGPMKKYLPPGYTGCAVWHINKGELSGIPRLIPAR